MVDYRRRMSGVAFLVAVLAATLPAHAAEHAVVEAHLLEDLKYLAGPECEGRGIRTKGIHLAVEHIAREFKKAGLKPGNPDGTFFQPFALGGSAKLGEGNKLALRGPQGQRIELEMGKHFSLVGLGGAGEVKAPVVFAGYGISSGEPKYDDYAGVDVAGKVVIVLRRVPQQGSAAGAFVGGQANALASLISKGSNAEVHKAAAVLFVSNRNLSDGNGDQLANFQETAESTDALGIPALHLRRHYVDHMLCSSLGSTLAEIEMDIDRDLKPRSKALEGWTCEIVANVQREGLPVKNVIGVLEGSGPLANETVVIGAHHDHLGFGGRGSLAAGSKDVHFGADDNASGTTAVIELARRFGQMKDRKGRRLVFMTFTAEESGLLGSAHYCKKPLFPLESTVAMVNMDMVGRLREDKITIGGTGTAKTFEALIDDINKKHKLQVTKDKSGRGPSDHQSFFLRKVPVFFFYTGMHQQYHRPSNTVDTISVPGIRKVVEMVEDLTSHLATVDPRPEYVQVGGSFNPGRIGVASGPRLGVMPDYADKTEGMRLEGVTDNGIAKKAGLLGGDRIIQIGDKPVKDVETYMVIMAAQKRGDTIEITIKRDGKTMKVPVKLE